MSAFHMAIRPRANIREGHLTRWSTMRSRSSEYASSPLLSIVLPWSKSASGTNDLEEQIIPGRCSKKTYPSFAPGYACRRGACTVSVAGGWIKYFCFLCGYTLFSKVSGTWKLVNYPDPQMNSFISRSNRFLRPIVHSEHPTLKTLRTWRKP